MQESIYEGVSIASLSGDRVDIDTSILVDDCEVFVLIDDIQWYLLWIETEFLSREVDIDHVITCDEDFLIGVLPIHGDFFFFA